VLIDTEPVRQPIGQQLLANCRIVVLAVFGAGFFRIRQPLRAIDALGNFLSSEDDFVSKKMERLKYRLLNPACKKPGSALNSCDACSEKHALNGTEFRCLRKQLSIDFKQRKKLIFHSQN
jgi:hypothetical protein